MNKQINLINKENIDKCLEYSDNKDKLRELINDLNVSITLLKYDKYFDDDTDFRNIYNVKMSRNNNKIFFKFGDSVSDTQNGITPDLYDVLCVVSSEFMYDYLDTDFNNFCDEFGYTEDSRKALKTFKNLQKINKKFRKIFDYKEIEVLPR